MQVFDVTDYKAYIGARIAGQEKTRGYHGRLAEAAGCRSSYLSQVLHGAAHLTPDQGAGLCEFWGLSDSECDYFLTLLALARAGTQALRRRLERQLKAARERHASLSARFQRARSIDSPDSIMTYYASWHLAAVHMLVGIPKFQTAEAIAARLGMALAMTQAALGTLKGMGLVVTDGAMWQRAQVDLHLPKDSPMAAVAHSNWRRRAEARYAENRESGLFYTGVHSLAVADIARVRAIVVDALEKSREVIADSPEEDIICVACDIFRA